MNRVTNIRHNTRLSWQEYTKHVLIDIENSVLEELVHAYKLHFLYLATISAGGHFNNLVVMNNWIDPRHSYVDDAAACITIFAQKCARRLY